MEPGRHALPSHLREIRPNHTIATNRVTLTAFLRFLRRRAARDVTTFTPKRLAGTQTLTGSLMSNLLTLLFLL